MKKITLDATVEVYASTEELSPKDAALLQKAKDAVERAYAPYSNFKVGSAVLLDNGKTYLGCNQENAAYPLCLCAERVALFAAATDYPEVPIRALAVTAKSGSKVLDEPITPCGSCRQAIYETEFRYKTPIRLVLQGETGEIYCMDSVRGLLPLMFNADYL